jgi:glycine/D-amino acid oxidase-like deaminating enzyme
VKAYPFWLDTLPPSEPAPPAAVPAPLPARVDAAIVGAGYTGLTAARHLARVGASVAVLEREAAGSGASSRNAGQVLTGLKVEPAALVHRYGEARARALFASSLEAIETLERIVAEDGIDCEYTRTGHLQAASKPSHYDAFLRERDLLARVFQHDVRAVSRDAQAADLGSARYFGLLIDERSGAINPARYVHGLAASARRAGAVLCERTTVQRITRAGSGWTVVTDRGDIAAGDVLVAANAYADAAAPFLQRRFVPVGSYIVVTERLDRAVAGRLLPTRRMAFDSKHFLYYFRLTEDDRFLFGGRAEFSTPTTASTARAAATLAAGLADVFPDLRGVRIEYAWSGQVAFTRDQLPRAGRIDGLYYAGGYCGHGVAMATHLGLSIARRMAGEPLEHPLFDDRFAPIPFYDGRPWFLPLAGAYYRVRDFIE